MNYVAAKTMLYRDHDSYSRGWALTEMIGKVRDQSLVKLLGHFWDTLDNLSECVDALMEEEFNFDPFKQQGTCHIPIMMSLKEQKALAALPERVTIYRGCGSDNQWGYCWALDRSVAVRFPFMSRYIQEFPLLLTATIKRSEITALKLDRKESEVILLDTPSYLYHQGGVKIEHLAEMDDLPPALMNAHQNYLRHLATEMDADT